MNSELQFTVFFFFLHNYLLLGALFCPFAVCRIWHFKHEALEKHAEPEGECGKLLNNMAWKHLWQYSHFFL